MIPTFRVELYNLVRGSRTVGNGYMVTRWVDGRRSNTIKRFENDRAAAYAVCAELCGMHSCEYIGRQGMCEYYWRVFKDGSRIMYAKVDGGILQPVAQ